MAAMAWALVLSSCGDGSDDSGSKVTREEAEELFSYLDESKKFEERVREMFSSEGIEINMFHAGGVVPNLDKMKSGPTMMICEGFADNEHILDFDKRFREAFTKEELNNIEVHYEFRQDNGDLSLMPIDLVRMVMELEGQQGEEGQGSASTPTESKKP